VSGSIRRQARRLVRGPAAASGACAETPFSDMSVNPMFRELTRRDEAR
jgi:hypothetical protein